MSGSESLTAKNTIFYSTASAGYAVFAATSLLAIRKYIPEAQLCILSSGLHDYDKKILDKHSIKYHELDLRDVFTKIWEYPIDCYYIFSGPEIFRKQGFDYSVYIDGDVLCRKNPLLGISDVKSVAGVESASDNGIYTSIFGKDWDNIKRVWNLPPSIASRRRINAGVVYFNNQAMSDIGLLDKAEELFKKSVFNEIPRKGDDSLFSLLQYVCFQEDDVKILPPEYNYVLQFHKDWRYPVDKLVFFHFSFDKPWKRKPYKHQNTKLDIYNPYVKEWRTNFRKTALIAWMLNVTANAKAINTCAEYLRDTLIKAEQMSRDQILWMLGLKKSLRTRRTNFHKSPLKVFWWRSEKKIMKNFGDEITSDIIDKVFGYRCERSEIDDCELIGTGSILEIAGARKVSNTIKVWGSGFIKEGKGEDRLEGLDFFAVRGEKTRIRTGKDIPLGDPGLLASIVYEKAKYKSDKIGVVVHYIDMDLPIVKKIKQDPRFTVINPLDKPADVARKITSCKLILSSSLHGLIFSDSFSVPNAHVQLSDRLSGGLYKFNDYYSAIDKEYRAADIKEIFNNDYLDKLKLSYRPVKRLRTIQKNIINSFPYGSKV